MSIWWIVFKNRARKTLSEKKMKLQRHFQAGKLIIFFNLGFDSSAFPRHLQSFSNCQEWVAATNFTLEEKKSFFFLVKVTII